MKKLLALCLALALLLSASALAEETAALTPADVTGTWYVIAYQTGGKTYSTVDLGLPLMYFVFNEDGTGAVTDESEGTNELEWEISGSSLVINGGLVFNMRSGILYYADDEEDMIMYLYTSLPESSPEEDPPADLPQADPAGDADLDIIGTWKLAYMKMGGKYYTSEETGAGTMILEFSADGTATVTQDDSSGSGVWTRDGKIITVREEEGEVQFVIENGNITFEAENVKLILTR